MHDGLCQGATVWARVKDPSGNEKRRPAVVISDQIVLDLPVVAVAITTTFPEEVPDTHVVLPFHPRGQTITGLRRRSAAVCNWLVTFRPGDVEGVVGQVPRGVLLEILKRVANLNS